MEDTNQRLTELISLAGGGNPQATVEVRRTRARGSVIIELVLAVPILVLLVLGGLDLLLAAETKGNIAYVAQTTASCLQRNLSACSNPQGYASGLAAGIGIREPVSATVNSCSGCSSVTVTLTTSPIGPFVRPMTLTSTAVSN